MRWTGHVDRITEIIKPTKLLLERFMGIDHSEYLGINGRIILKLKSGKKCSDV